MAELTPFLECAAANLPEIKANDNRLPGGSLKDAVLTIELEAREGTWFPEEHDGPGLHVQAFAEAGHSPEIPGPMIRVPEGTEISVDIQNAIPGSTLVIHGLHTRPGNSYETIEVLPGERREVRFRTGKPGTYYYWATTTGKALRDRYGIDSQLNGALIVDPQGTRADDRVFVIGWWEKPELRALGGDPFTQGRNAIVINGCAWPYTERLPKSDSFGDCVLAADRTQLYRRQAKRAGCRCRALRRAFRQMSITSTVSEPFDRAPASDWAYASLLYGLKGGENRKPRHSNQLTISEDERGYGYYCVSLSNGGRATLHGVAARSQRDRDIG